MKDYIQLTDHTEDSKPINVKVYFTFDPSDDDMQIRYINYGGEIIEPSKMDEKLHPDLICDIEHELEKYSEENRIKGEITHRFP